LLFSSTHLKKVGLKKSPKFLANIIHCVHAWFHVFFFHPKPFILSRVVASNYPKCKPKPRDPKNHEPIDISRFLRAKAQPLKCLKHSKKICSVCGGHLILYPSISLLEIGRDIMPTPQGW
jgi:hypothetical protein